MFVSLVHNQNQTTLEVANQTCQSAEAPAGRQDESAYSSAALQRWLQPATCRAPQTDYENCRALQEQLRADAFQSVSSGGRPMLSRNASSLASLLNDRDEDENYAESMAETTSASSDERPEESSLPAELTSGRQQAKEVTLKVLLDDDDDQIESSDSNGDEVFYINPLVSFKFVCRLTF